METLLAVVVGVLYATGMYMMLRRSIVKLVIGLALIAHGANLLIFTAAGITRGRAPLVPEGAERVTGDFADPVSQALILTAIVIGFGLLAFAVVLIHRVHQSLHCDDVEAMRANES
ncbi:MAG: Na+/H+ antiporter subunit C [Myxococcales bacterium]